MLRERKCLIHVNSKNSDVIIYKTALVITKKPQIVVAYHSEKLLVVHVAQIKYS